MILCVPCPGALRLWVGPRLYVAGNRARGPGSVQASLVRGPGVGSGLLMVISEVVLDGGASSPRPGVGAGGPVRSGGGEGGPAAGGDGGVERGPGGDDCVEPA